MTKHEPAPGLTSQRSLAQSAYEQIQNMIVTGSLRPNELVSESDLTRKLGSGRTPVREALQRLSYEGFVNVLPRRGIMVTPVDVTSQLELLETRRPLEVQMVQLAARRASPQEREQMRELADKLELAVANDDRELYLEINRAIHRIEARACGNRFLQSQIDVIHNLSRRFWYSFISDTRSFSKAAELHARTLRSIAAGDAEAAIANSNALLDLLDRVTRSAIEDRMR